MTRSMACTAIRVRLLCYLPSRFEAPAAKTSSILHTNGKKMTDLDNDLPVCSVENIQLWSDGRSYVHVCTGSDVENDLILGKVDEKPIKKREKIVCAVQPTERQTAGGKVPTIEELTVKKTKKACCGKATSQVVMSESEFQAEHNGLSVRTLKIDACVQNGVTVCPRARTPYAKHYPRIVRHTGERRTYDKTQMEFFWPHMASDVYQTVSSCATSPRNR